MKKRVCLFISLLLILTLSFAFALETDSIDLKDLAGEWEGWGSIDDGFYMTFTLDEDGLGQFTLDRKGHRDTFPIRLIAENHTFSVDVFPDNKLSMTKCNGVWQYQNELMMLNMNTIFKKWGRFLDYILCQRVDKTGIENGPNSLEAKLGKCMDADHRFVLPGNITWESTIADVAALTEGRYIEQGRSLAKGVLLLLNKRAAPWKEGTIRSGYCFRDDELVFAVQEIRNKINTNEGFFNEFRATLSSVYGEPSLSDFSQIYQCMAVLGFPSEELTEIESAPWCAWMLPDQNTLAFAMGFKGTAIFYFNTARLLK